jgi:hypothetical protein
MRVQTNGVGDGGLPAHLDGTRIESATEEFQLGFSSYDSVTAGTGPTATARGSGRGRVR